MPRNYTRKSNKAAYSKEVLQDAIRAVKNGSMSAYAASKHYNIPRTTIVNRIYERRGFKSNTLGRSTILSHEIEESLAHNLHIMEKYGFGLTRKEMLQMVGEYVNANCISNPFKNGVPGEDWFLRFKKRHTLSVKKPQPVEYARKNACRPDVIYPYFDLLENTMNELKLCDKPSHIYNIDETSFSKDPSKTKVIGLKGFTSTRTISSSGKDNITVLLGCNAVGEKLPPLIIYKGKSVWDEWTSEEGYPGTVYAATANGWMETTVFETYFEKVFIPIVKQNLPILLIYDGHSSHVGINIIEKARAAGITILKIPPHTSDVLQPLDLSVNKSFKDKWDAALVKWQRRNIGKILPKKEFSKLIGEIWAAVEPTVCSAGFRKAGIYPLNKNAVPEKKFNQILLQEWKSQTTDSEKPGIIVDSTLSRKQYQSDTAPYELCPDLCCNDDTINFFFEQWDELYALKDNQPELLINIVLASINKVISGSPTGTLQHSYSVQREANYLLENKLSASSSQIESSVASHVHQTLLSEQKCVPVSKYHDISLNNKFNTAQKSSLLTNHDTCTSKVKILENRVVSFEELLLRSVKGGISTKAKRRKVATGGELITNDDVYKRCKVLEAEKEKKVLEKELKTKQREEKSKAKELIKKSKQDKNEAMSIKKEKQNKKTDPSGLSSTIPENISTAYDNALKKGKISKGKGVGKRTKISNKKNTLLNHENVPPRQEKIVIAYDNALKQEKISKKKQVVKRVKTYNKENTLLSPENVPPNFMISIGTEPGSSGLCTQKTKKRNWSLESDGSTTSISDNMSEHTDSSIFEVESDGQSNEEHIESEQNYKSLPILRESPLLHSYEVSNLPTLVDFTPNITGTSVAFPSRSPEILCLNPPTSRGKVLENHDDNDIILSSEQDNNVHLSNTVQVTSIYFVDDTVLVRYFLKKTWKYYIGIVTACNDNRSYDISFYTTIRNKGELQFKMPKKKDRDTVPEESIVKIIEIQVSDKPEVYMLRWLDDKIYF